MPKPPLGLSVEICDASGSRHRWDSAGKAACIPQGLSFSTKKFEGFEAASCTLSRRIDRDYVDIGLYHDVAFIGDDGSVAYEGRIASNPRSLGEASHQMTVNCAGWMAHAKDRDFSEIYVDRGLSGWEGGSRAWRVARLTGSRNIGDISAVADGTGGLPALVETHQGPWGGVSGASADAWYDAGTSTVAAVYYDFVPSSTVNTADANWYWALFNSASDATTTGTNTGNLRAASGSGYWTPATAMRYVGAEFTYTVAYTGSSQFELYWRKLAVYGNHGLTRRGSDPGGLYASDVLTNVISRFCPKLSTAGIQATTYAIPHLVFKDRTSPYDAFLELNKFHLWQFGVWEGKKFCFQPNDLTDYDWEVRLSDPGVTVELQGDSTEDLANGIVVQYTDVGTGRQATLTPDDTPSLSDTSVTNPANSHGLKVWTEISVSSPTTAEAAAQIGVASLAEFNQPKAPGTIRVKGHIKDRAGHWQQGFKVRAGQRVVITDHPNSRVRLIGETSWDHESKTLTIACDTTIERLPAVFDRIGVALSAANLS